MEGKLTPQERFWKLLKPDSREIKHVYIYGVFNGLVGLTLPLGIQAIINFIQGGRISASWLVLVVLTVLGVAFTGVLQIMQLRITENLQQRIFSRAAFEFAYRIPRIRLDALYKHYAPELMNRFFDTIAVQKGLSKILIEFSTAALSALFGLLLLAFYHQFFILFSAVLIMLIITLIRFTAKKGMKTSLRESKYKYQVAHWLEELARTSTTFKLAGNTDLPLIRVDRYVSKYLVARESHFKILVQQYSLLVVFKVSIATALLAIGGILVMDQRMNIGQFVAAEIIILLVMNSVEKLVLSLETIYDVLTALEKIGQVTDMKLERSEGLSPTEQITGKKGLQLSISNLTFRYPGATADTLRELNLLVEKGESIALAGNSGSGKSTLLNLIAGLFDPQQGSIAYDGLPTGNLNLIELRSIIGDFMAQEQIFEGSIMDNITMGREDVSFENVKHVVEKVRLTEFIRSLPRGYDTSMEPMGKKYPNSVVLKLLLARSIADNPKLLLMEDALESLPEDERKGILEFLISDQNGWTTIVATEDPYLLSKVNKVVILEDGQITNHIVNQKERMDHA